MSNIGYFTQQISIYERYWEYIVDNNIVNIYSTGYKKGPLTIPYNDRDVFHSNLYDYLNNIQSYDNKLSFKEIDKHEFNKKVFICQL
jgi:hypothetical protein